MPALGVGGYLAALPVAIQQERDELFYRTYITDALQAIAENTGSIAAGLSNGNAGKAMPRRWVEGIKVGEYPAKEEKRTPEEIIANIKEKLATV